MTGFVALLLDLVVALKGPITTTKNYYLCVVGMHNVFGYGGICTVTASAELWPAGA
jgi:hypothetical protein